MKRHEHEEQVMIMSPEDRQQVRAILLTHAEMQDRSAITSMELLARIKRDEPEEEDMIDELEDQIEVLEDDSDNLKRLGNLFT
jgi:hypothetical protein